MSERYVKDILEKLEEIEKLHAKLRSLVPRVKNYETEKLSINALKASESMNDNQSKGNDRNPSETNEKKLFAFPARVSSIRSATYLKNLKNRSNEKWRRLRRDSVNFIGKQWHDVNDRIKTFLSTMKERHIILVTRAAQTSDDDRSEAVSRRQSVTGSGEMELSSREDRLPKRRRRTVQRLLERLLEHFNYSRDPSLVNEDRVSMQQAHPLGNSEPRRVQRASLLPDEEAQTLRVVSSAQSVSIDDNRESYSGKRSPNNRAQAFFRTYV